MRYVAHVSILVVVAAVALLGGCDFAALAKATEVRTQSTAYLEGAQLVVQNVNGTIDVIAETGREDVLVTAEITAGGATQERADERLKETQLIVTRDTNRTLTITTEFPKPSSGGDTANLTVRIPGATDVSVTSVNGSITVAGMDAPMELRTTNGRVTLRDSKGDASVRTVNGRIQIENHSGAVTIRTTNGRVTLEEHAGSAAVTTVNGRVTVSLTPDQPGPLDIRTTNGRIEATVGPAFAGEITLTTGNGSINIHDVAGLVRSQDSSRRASTLQFDADGEKSTLSTSNGRITFTTNQ